MTKPVSKKSSNTMSLNDLDDKFNPNVIVPKRIEKALKVLGANAMTALDFSKAAGITTTQLAQFSEQFEEYQISVRDNGKLKNVWCGTKEFAQAARDRLGL